MDNKYLTIGGIIFIVIVLIISVIMILINYNSGRENYTYTSTTTPPPRVSFGTEKYDPKFSATREGSHFMIIDKNGNIDRMGLGEVEGRLVNMMNTVETNFAKMNSKVDQVQWRVEDRISNLSNTINTYFPDGGKSVSLASDGPARVKVTHKQLGVLNGQKRFVIRNQGNENQNKYLMYDRDSNEAKWGPTDKKKITTNAGDRYQTDFTIETL